VLDLADTGLLDANSPRAAAIRRRMEGIIIAAEQAAGVPDLGPEPPQGH
jgi:hypothetical protein